MRKKTQPTPNTNLGEVYWTIDSFFGSLLFSCQGMLGKDRVKHDNFLDTTQHSVDDLWELFNEVELETGYLGLELFADDCHSLHLAFIETKLLYGEEINDQTFLNFIDDFVEHVRGLPLADPDKREGALWTDEDIERGYSPAANQLYIEAWQTLEEVFEQAHKSTEVEF